MKIRQSRKSLQSGVMLIEALVAILLFSVGVVAVMGMQAVAIEQVSQAKYRTDASYLANQIIGTMWTDRPNISSYTTSAYAKRSTWDTVVGATLPQGTGTITVTGSTVTVTVNWRTPNDSTTRKFVTIATIV